jgi:hypothetical protein
MISYDEWQESKLGGPLVPPKKQTHVASDRSHPSDALTHCEPRLATKLTRGFSPVSATSVGEVCYVANEKALMLHSFFLDPTPSIRNDETV